MKILVVDDDSGIRKLMSLVLEGAGCEVIHAESGAEALKAVAAEPVNLVITDFNMPEMDGLELVSALRADDGNRKLPILIHSSESDPALQERGRNLGANGWVMKPCTPENWRRIVDVLRPLSA